MMGHPSVNDCENAVKHGHIENCPVTLEDIAIAEEVFGPDIHALKGKTIRKAPPIIEVDCIEVPQEMLKSHDNVAMGLDVMKVNGPPFPLTVSSKLKFMTVEFLENVETDDTCNCHKTVAELCNSGGFCVAHLLGDPQFDSLKLRLKKDFNTDCNGVAAQEHIPEAERMIRVIEERTQASISGFPWKEATPKSTVKETVKHCVTMTNSFPPKSGIETHLSPQTTVTGETLDHNEDFEIPFGDHAQVHENEEPRNGAKEQTQGAISLGPTWNASGGHKFFNLASGKLI